MTRKNVLIAVTCFVLMTGGFWFVWNEISTRQVEKERVQIEKMNDAAPLEKIDDYGVYLRQGTRILLHDGATNQNIKIDGVDAGTFEPLNCPYARDKDRVYSFGIVLQGADPSTIKTFGSCYGVVFYTLDASRVYYEGKPIEGADPATFQILDPEMRSEYARDAEHVYFQGKQITEADAETFSVLGDSSKRVIYGRDKNLVYYEGHAIDGSIGASFNRGTKKLHGVQIYNADGNDEKSVYFYGDRYDDVTKALIIDQGKIPSGVARTGSYFTYDDDVYCIEGIKGYVFGNKMDAPKPETFKDLEHLGGPYYKDKERVYYECRILEDADPDSFEILSLEERRAKDKNTEFSWNSKVME